MTLFPKCCGCQAGRGWSKDPSRQGETRRAETRSGFQRSSATQPSLQPQEEVLIRLQPKGVAVGGGQFKGT